MNEYLLRTIEKFDFGYQLYLEKPIAELLGETEIDEVSFSIQELNEIEERILNDLENSKKYFN